MLCCVIMHCWKHVTVPINGVMFWNCIVLLLPLWESERNPGAESQLINIVAISLLVDNTRNLVQYLDAILQEEELSVRGRHHSSLHLTWQRTLRCKKYSAPKLVSTQDYWEAYCEIGQRAGEWLKPKGEWSPSGCWVRQQYEFWWNTSEV